MSAAFVTHDEVLIGKNAFPRYRLVKVDLPGAQHDESRYLGDPFRRELVQMNMPPG